MLTLRELQEKLKNVDEISLLEVLEISSEDIVNKFIDKIDDKYDYLVTEFLDEEDMPTDPELDFDYEDEDNSDAG